MLFKYFRKVFVFAAFLCCAAAAVPVPCAAEVRVGILPVIVYSSDDIGFMGSAVQHMLLTRLDADGEIKTISSAEMNLIIERFGWDALDEEKAVVMGKKLRADFMIAGTLTQIGKKYSLDVMILPITGTGSPRRLSITAEELAGIPYKLQDFARRLNFAILDKQMVADVEVKGNRFIEDDAVLYAIQTKPGDVFSPAVLQEDLKSIYQMGYFEDIQISSTDTDAGKHIVFTVQEKPMIRAIQIKGNQKIKLEDIRKVMEVKPRTILDINKIKGDVERISKVYREKGYYNVDVSYSIEEINEYYASVDFAISEGSVVKVTEVTFTGNESMPDKELKRIMETREKHWLLSLFTGRGVFRDEALQKDMDRIVAYYYSKGFLQAQVREPDVQFKDDGIHVHFTVNEGSRFTVGSVDLKGDLIFDAQTLKDTLDSATGETFNGKVLNDDMIALKELYAENGFANADITPLTHIQDEAREVDLVFDIDKGEKIYIEEIKITGNTRTRDNVIRREMRVSEGSIYSSKAIKRSKQEINNLGFFEEVNINTEPGSKSNLVRLRVEVKERPTGAFSIGAGYSSVDNLVGMFQISQSNLFGTGRNVHLMAQLGGHSNYYNISFTEPRYKNTELAFGFDLFNIERAYEDFDRDSSGFKLRTSFPFRDWDYTRLYLTYRFESIDIDIVDDEDDVALDILRQEGSNSVSSIAAALIKDSRDDRWQPRKGVYNTFSVELAGLGGDSKFITVIGSLAKYFPLPWDTAFLMRGTIGQIFPYNSERIPISEKFFLGGLDSMRGFEVRSVGPREPRPRGPREIYIGDRKFEIPRRGYHDDEDVVGGKKELFFNFEYLFPLMKEAGVRGMIFYDTGNAYGSGENFFSDMRHCVGVGINWYSPFGPLRLVWGLNLNPRDDEDSSNFEFSMGRMF